MRPLTFSIAALPSSGMGKLQLIFELLVYFVIYCSKILIQMTSQVWSFKNNLLLLQNRFMYFLFIMHF